MFHFMFIVISLKNWNKIKKNYNPVSIKNKIYRNISHFLKQGNFLKERLSVLKATFDFLIILKFEGTPTFIRKVIKDIYL